MIPTDGVKRKKTTVVAAAPRSEAIFEAFVSLRLCSSSSVDGVRVLAFTHPMIEGKSATAATQSKALIRFD